jgi:hypothetical protein
MPLENESNESSPILRGSFLLALLLAKERKPFVTKKSDKKIFGLHSAKDFPEKKTFFHIVSLSV